ncbi:NAD-dependent epimerase/dehydratase family protein [Pacificibacter marinus]|uniref:3 beta-hydroxysteroid dehydrogenase/Delta 5-->4-isomerase n=1 Tax=Pacificibacter marinus TaxID=658057 RepID=A0A1Y5TLH6_9RHOB|nr:NAD-dependent epimerase/dehydratase family protein [Pacificibacter marinus]SEL28783.1 Nucleoside-diphosphate-sugar epimerase [Pacificibacter marinus]SLN66744.1 3 beta-hydroxysteroid dehydrogenase/Delta 5-->4-isomerase [Pacificibacter marinus]
MKTVLLTGVTGFLGGHLAVALLRAGYKVRGSLRTPSRSAETEKAIKAAGVDVSHLEFVELDLTKDAGWAEACDGVDYLMHAASPFVTSMPKDKAELITPAVEGTQRALTAARDAGLARVVLTSSIAAIVPGRGKSGPSHLDASDWADPDGEVNAYVESKIRAEMKAWEILKPGTTKTELAVINPAFIVGPLLDSDPGTSGALFQRFLRGEVPVAPHLYMHSVDVRDLADMHVAALTAPAAAGARTIASFGVYSIMQMATCLKKGYPDYSKKMPKFQAPDWFIRLYALVDADVRGSVKELGYNPILDEAPGRALLGRAPIRIADSYIATAQSLIERNLA